MRERRINLKRSPLGVDKYCIKPTQQEARQLEMRLKNLTSKKRLEQFIKKYSSGGPGAPAGGLDADDPAPHHEDSQ